MLPRHQFMHYGSDTTVPYNHTLRFVWIVYGFYEHKPAWTNVIWAHNKTKSKPNSFTFTFFRRCDQGFLGFIMLWELWLGQPTMEFLEFYVTWIVMKKLWIELCLWRFRLRFLSSRPLQMLWLMVLTHSPHSYQDSSFNAFLFQSVNLLL